LRIFNAPALVALGLLSAASVFPFLPALHVDAKNFVLEVSLTSTKAGHVQVYWDDGGGYSERNSSMLPVPGTATPAVYRLPIPLGVYNSLRFDPIDNDATVVVDSARVADDQGRPIRTLGFGDFSALNQIQSLSVGSRGLEIVVVPGGGDPQLLLRLEPPLRIHYAVKSIAREWVARAAIVFALLATALAGFARAGALRLRLAGLAHSLANRPGWAVVSVSAFAVLLSAYPVVFGGKSLVAPITWDSRLLYDGIPTLPGYPSTFVTDAKGSDVGAVLWEHIPFSMIEHRAMFRDGEWPLWNRYNSAGSPLLGQGQSMFGNPLHLLVQAANGAAWAWDCDYLLEKWLLAVGLGLLVLAVTRRTFPALVVSLAAPFFGFFVYRLNHPAFFSFCTAPWPLYCWIRVSGARSLRSAGGWAAALILANIALMDSGTVKEAYVLLLAMNFSGLCVLLAAEETWRATFGKLAVAAWALVLFAMIGAPMWMTFLSTLRESYTSYTAVSAFQIQPSLLIGAFDEAFYRPLTPGGHVFNPSANFLILAGVIYFLATLRTHFAHRTAIVLAASSLVPLALAFGLVPPSWIEQAPFLRNVAHIDNCFSCALIILWSVIAGVGFSAAADRLGTPKGGEDLAIAALLLFALLFHYLAFGHAIHRTLLASEPVYSPQSLGETMRLGLFVGTYLSSLVAALAALGWIARRCLRTGTLTSGAALGLILCAWVFLWRQGLQPESEAFQDYTVRPGPRPDFHADSPAMDRMRGGQASEPSRGVGLEGAFFPGWSAAYGLEGISGPDALVNPFYRELTGLSPITRVWDWRLILTKDTVPAARPFLDFLNVRYYFCMPGAGPLDSGLVLTGHDDLDTYESPTVWPRAFFTDRLAVYDDPSDLVQLVLKGDGRPFAAAQAKDLEKDALEGVSRGLIGRTSIPASGYVLTERKTSFTLHASGPGLAVLSEAFLPGYGHAEVNGVEAKVLRLNHSFQGLMIHQAGDYRVTFSYAPRGFGISLVVGASGIGLLILSAAAVFRMRDTKPATASIL
jgi:hypothetical protein